MRLKCRKLKGNGRSNLNIQIVASRHVGTGHIDIAEHLIQARQSFSLMRRFVGIGNCRSISDLLGG